MVKKEVNPAIYREIRALGIPGITGERTAQRIYPTSMALGQLVGFVRPDDQSGAGGIEQMLDKDARAGPPGSASPSGPGTATSSRDPSASTPRSPTAVTSS